MTNVYFVRHCETESNLLRIFQGQINTDITETGARQLRCLSERFENIELDHIYTSPLTRAYKTAQAICGKRDLPIDAVDELMEMDVGVLEGQNVAESFRRYPELDDTWHNRPQDFDPEGGETMRQVYDRIWKTVQRLVRENPGKTIALTSHGGSLRCLLCQLLYQDIEKLNETPLLENTAVSLAEFDEDLRFRVCYCNDTSHLSPDLLPHGSSLRNL